MGDFQSPYTEGNVKLLYRGGFRQHLRALQSSYVKGISLSHFVEGATQEPRGFTRLLYRGGFAKPLCRGGFVNPPWTSQCSYKEEPSEAPI